MLRAGTAPALTAEPVTPPAGPRPIHYDGMRFRPVGDDAEVGRRVALYRQEGDLLWGEFQGGHARRGSLAGRCAPDGTLEFTYCMVLDSGELVSGRCLSTPFWLPDGRIQLQESWERYGPSSSSGVSLLEEIPQQEIPPDEIAAPTRAGESA